MPGGWWRARRNGQRARGNYRALAVLRYLDQQQVYFAVGGLLMLGSAVAAAVSWPPGAATVRPFGVGVLLILRGAVRYFVLRRRRRRMSDRIAGG